MSDDNEKPQIAVNKTPMLDQAQSAIRAFVLVASVVTALAGLVSKRDWAGFITYVQSSDFLGALAVVCSFGTLAWGQWKTRHRAKQLVTIASDPRVPDEVAVLKP